MVEEYEKEECENLILMQSSSKTTESNEGSTLPSSSDPLRLSLNSSSLLLLNTSDLNKKSNNNYNHFNITNNNHHHHNHSKNIINHNINSFHNNHYQHQQQQQQLNSQSIFLPTINSYYYSNYFNNNPVPVNFRHNPNPTIPSHMAHSRTASNGSNISLDPSYHMNYRTHSRSASGTMNPFGPGSVGSNAGPSYHHHSHSRSASGGGISVNNFQIDQLIGTGSNSRQHWTNGHSRNASNCSNISFISRFSEEPISEVDSAAHTLFSSTNNLNSNVYATSPSAPPPNYFIPKSTGESVNTSVNPACLNTVLTSLAACQQYSDQVTIFFNK
jgi:hypothetical protein